MKCFAPIIAMVFASLISSAVCVPVPLEGLPGDLETTIEARGKGKPGKGKGKPATSKVTSLPSKSIRCGGGDARGTTWSASRIQNAAQASYNLYVEGKQKGALNYPHNFGGNAVGFSNAACKAGQKLIEYPMSVGVYAGEAVNELPDRVIIKIDGKKAVFCGLVTHIGQPGNGFARCG